MNAPGHFDFYTFVLFLHIASAVIAFGATFAFPIIDVTIRRVDLRALPGWSEAQNQIGMKLITPGAILVLLSGIYMGPTAGATSAASGSAPPARSSSSCSASATASSPRPRARCATRREPTSPPARPSAAR